MGVPKTKYFTTDKTEVDTHDIVILDSGGEYILAYAHEDILSRYCKGLMENLKETESDGDEGYTMIEGLKRFNYYHIFGDISRYRVAIEAFHYVLVFAYSPDDFPFYDLCCEGADACLFLHLYVQAFFYNIEELKDGLYNALKSFRDLNFVCNVLLQVTAGLYNLNVPWKVEVRELCKKIILEDFAEWNAMRFSESDEGNNEVCERILDAIGSSPAQEAFVRLIQKVVRGENEE